MPPPKFFRLKPGGEVRLKYAYIIKCDEVVKDAAGAVIELRCTADLESKSGGATAGRKVKGTIHWVSAAHAIDAEVRLYDRLFTEPDPEKRWTRFPHGAQSATRWKSSPRKWSRRWRERHTERSATSSSGSPISPRRQGRFAGQARLQPHDHFEGHVGEGRDKSRAKRIAHWDHAWHTGSYDELHL